MRPLLVLLGAAALAAAPRPAPAADAPAPRIDDRTRQAITRALDYLKAKQNRDGSWDNGSPAVTAYALLAFLANGHLPHQGPYGPEVARGARFLLAAARPDGRFAAADSSHYMYHHGMATLALTQLVGMTPDDETKAALKRAVAVIVRSQNREGGWRYQPEPNDADMSVTVMQVMALRGAKDSGLYVPDQTMARALAYIDKCHEASSGGYLYQPNRYGAKFAMTAAGACVLLLCGEYAARPIDRAVEFLLRRGDDREHYWYGHYYAVHALHQVGGKAWDEYYGRMRDRLLKGQNPSGGWTEPRDQGGGPTYQTAIGVLVLSVPAHYLPIYQR